MRFLLDSSLDQLLRDHPLNKCKVVRLLYRVNSIFGKPLFVELRHFGYKERRTFDSVQILSGFDNLVSLLLSISIGKDVLLKSIYLSLNLFQMML